MLCMLGECSKAAVRQAYLEGVLHPLLAHHSHFQ